MTKRFFWLTIFLLLSLGLPSLMAQESTPESQAPTNTLVVSEVFPSDDAIIPLDSEILILFNRPVVPLVTSLQMDTLPNPIVIEPAIDGKAEWLNTSIFTFKPTLGFSGGTRYTVTVPEGLVAADGTVLEEGATFSFNTESPEITELVPAPNDENIILNPKIQVRFSQDMNRESVENNFTFMAQDGASSLTGTFEWAEDNRGFAFTPNERLELSAVYEVAIGDGAQGINGGELGGTRSWEFSTIPFPAILSTYPTDGETDVYPYGSVTITFASPMNIESIEERIIISPEVAAVEGYWSDYSNTYELYFERYGSARYTVTLEAGAEDIYGNVLNEGVSFSFTSAPYDADLSLRVPRDVGFYNAYREPSGFYLTHLNVSRVDLDFYSVPTDIFIERLLGESYYNLTYDYKPTEEQRIQSWSIPNVAPQNATRFELLPLGDINSGANFACNALAPRAKVGDIVRVLADPPLRARSEPVTGEILKLIYANDRIKILQGPVCVDNIVWFEVPLGDGRNGWIAESLDEEYFIEVAEASSVTTFTIPTAGESSTLTPGIYFLEAQAPEVAERGYQSQKHMMVVGTANLMMKTSMNEVTVWATNVQTGESLEGATIKIYGEGSNNPPLAQGVTNAEGLIRLALPRAESLYSSRIAVLDDGENFGVAFSEWSNGLDAYQFGVNADYFPRDYRVYAYTDRPIYRPDQPVYFKGIVRQKDDIRYIVDREITDVPVKITDYNGNIVFDERVAVNEYGTFTGTFNIAPDAPLGYYYLDITLGSDDDNYSREGGGVSFMVAEYRVPEFQVTLSSSAPEVVQGDTVEVQIDSRYFFGGAVSNANVLYTVIASNYSFDYTGRNRYSFNDINYDGGPDEFYEGTGEVASGEEVSDASGIVTISLPATLKDATRSQTFTVEASVTDESNQFISGRTQVVIHKGLIYAGVRPLKYVSIAEETATLELIAVDWESNPIANQEIDVRIVERRWYSVQEQGSDGRTNWTWEVEEIPVLDDGKATTNSEGLANFEFVPPLGGVYKAYVTSRDSVGNEVIASTTFWVAGENYVSWRQQNSNRIDLISDKDDYQIGDVAEILITSPYQGTAEALITVERDGLLDYERVTLESNSYVYRLPIEEGFLPNVFVGVLLLKGVDETNPVASFRAGYVQLDVETTRRVITLEIESDVDQTQPQDTVTYTIRATDYEGKPVQAEIGVGVTDLAVLSLLPSNSEPLLPFFYGQQSLSVRNSSALTINADAVTQEILDTIKGGGGGFLADGLVEIRGEFIDTPFWNATLETDENGVLVFDVKLPDNLTTWRLDARAITKSNEMKVGEETFDIISTKLLIIRPITPRFFIRGDQASLAAVVNNNALTEQEVVVTLNATGVTINSPLSQTITIPAQSRGRVTWDVLAEDVTAVVATFRAQSGEYNDGSISPVSLDDIGTLPVYRYDVKETVGTAGVLTTTESITETLLIPDGQDIGQASVALNIDHSLASSALESLDRLILNQYAYLEWSISSMRVSLTVLKTLKAGNVDNPALQTKATSIVNDVIQRLYARQQSDGGWGWSGNLTSDPMTSAYSLLALAEARDGGFTVSNEVLKRAQEYLRTQFVNPSFNTPYWQLNRQAFLLYTMARSGSPDVGRTNALFDVYERLSLYGQALLAQTLYLINPNDASRTETLVSVFIRDAKLSASGASWEERGERDYWNWNTDTRTTAIVLSTLLKLRPESELLSNAVRYLVVQRKSDMWETLQETTWALDVLSDWLVVTGELNPDYSYRLTLDGTPLTQETAVTPDNADEGQRFILDVRDNLLSGETLINIARTGTDEGALYYTARLTIDLPVPDVEAFSNGIFVERRYTLNGGDGQTPITEANAGDIVDVRLTIIVPDSLNYVVIEDPLPGGAEGINPNLSTSTVIGTRPSFTNSNNSRRYGWGWWWFSNIEFRDEKVVLTAPYLPRGTYEFKYSMRASVAGVYNVIPTTAQEVYFPEVYGRSNGSAFTIKE